MSEKENVTLEDALRLIEDKFSQIEEYFKISQKQNSLLENGKYNEREIENQDDFSEIESLIEEKDTIIKKVNSLDDEFVETFERYKKTLKDDNLDSIADNETFKKLQDYIRLIFEKLEEIKKIEIDNQDKLNEVFDGVKKDIKNFNESTKNQIPERPVTDLDKGFYVDEKK